MTRPLTDNGTARAWARLFGLCLGVSAIIAAFSSRAAADTWYEHYENAEKALQDRDWTEAIAQINQALERRGDSGARVRTYGMRVISYFPYLKLGIAYYELDQLDAALQAFETEERLGAIAGDDTARAELQRFRDLAQKARELAASAELAHIAEIVREGLEQATAFEEQGRLDDAVSALGRGLAVAPDDPESLKAMERLRNKIALEQERRVLEARVARLIEEGKSLLDDRQYEAASSLLRQALSLQPTEEIESLLGDAQARLRSELQGLEDARQRSALVADGLARVREAEAAGETVAALTELQSVLALDPSNQQALQVQIRLLRAREAADQERSRRSAIEELLAQAEADLGAGRYESCLTAANRVLALDPSNVAALQYVAKAYLEVYRQLLGTAARQNMPPAIRFVDVRQEMDDGSQVQFTRSPDFRLTGVVIDSSPVEIVFYDQEENELPATANSQPFGELTLTEFSLSHELSPGASTFRMVATDANQLSSSSEYAVLYRRPLLRSPWFYTVLAASMALLVGALHVQRHRKRQRLLGRRFNPYVAGAPVLDDNLFFGRRRLLDRILQTIHNNSLLLYGERRIGKTSIQHHLKKRLQSLRDPVYDFYPVYIDLQGTPEERFFATIAEDVFQELAPLLDGVEPVPRGPAYSYRELVRDMRQVLKRLQERSSKRVRLVLLMDEVDELNHYDPRINQKLRSLFMKSFAENLVAVVSGVEIKKHWEGETSPWYNFFEEIEVKPFRREDAEELIERPIRGIFKIDKDVADRIISLTGSRPYLIQKLCIALVDRLHEQNRRAATLADVEAVSGSIEARAS